MKEKITFVTSFNEKGLIEYGISMLQSAAKYWDPEFSLVVYYDGFKIEDYQKQEKLPHCPFITYVNMDEISALLTFQKRMKDYNGLGMGCYRKLFGGVNYNYRYDACRFSFKVYAVTEHALKLIDKYGEGEKGWLVWLDADTLTHKKMAPKDLEKIFSDGADLVHLGRGEGFYADYSETGFVAYNLKSDKTLNFLKDYRWLYDSGEIVRLKEWHDCWSLDRLIARYKHFHNLKVKNLFFHQKHCKFSRTYIGNFMTHVKGEKEIEGWVASRIGNNRGDLSKKMRKKMRKKRAKLTRNQKWIQAIKV